MARNSKRARRNRRKADARKVSRAVEFRRKHGPTEMTASWHSLEEWEKAEIKTVQATSAHKRTGMDARDRARKHDRMGKAHSKCNRWRAHDARGRICGRPLDKVENQMLVRFPIDKRNATRLLDVLYKD